MVEKKALFISYTQWWFTFKEKRNVLWLSKVNVIVSHGKATHDFLLHEGRLDKLLKAIEIDKMYENNNMFSLLKKSLGMKIFVKHLALHGPKVVEIIDAKFRHNLIEYLLKLYSNITLAKDLSRFD